MFIDTYLVMLRHEVELFTRHVTDWELTRYREVM
jgi:glutamine synthetase